jgi:hypothetical protein
MCDSFGARKPWVSRLLSRNSGAAAEKMSDITRGITNKASAAIRVPERQVDIDRGILLPFPFPVPDATSAQRTSFRLHSRAVLAGEGRRTGGRFVHADVFPALRLQAPGRANEKGKATF